LAGVDDPAQGGAVGGAAGDRAGQKQAAHHHRGRDGAQVAGIGAGLVGGLVVSVAGLVVGIGRLRGWWIARRRCLGLVR
jgi:hypothetical protein